MADLAKLRALGLDPTLIRLLAQREADQSVSAPAQQPSEPQGVQAAPPQAIASPTEIPPFTPEEKESLIGQVGRKALSGLQWVGESLDKPGRALRGVLGGEFNEIFDIIPFSDTLGLTTPDDDVSGRDLLEKAGVLEANTPGLDAGDVAGTALEIATDPFSWISGGGTKVASKVLSEGAPLAQALTAATKADEIASGARSLLTVHTPSFGIPLPGKIPFTNVEIPRVQVPVKELAQIGTGEKAAALYKALNYGKFSPNPYVRKVFSALPEVNEMPVKQQEIADRLAEARVRAMDDAAGSGTELLKQEQETQLGLADLADKTFFGKPLGRLHMISEAVEQSASASAEVQSLLKSRLGSAAPDWAAVRANPEQLKKVAQVYDDIMRNQKQYGGLADDLKARHEELLSNIFEQGNSKDPFHAKWFDDSIREFVESKDNFGLGYITDSLKASGFSESVEGFDSAAKAMYELADNMRGLYKRHLTEMTNLGIDVEKLNDYYVGYSHRRPSAPEGSPLYNYMRRRLVKTGGAPFMIARDDVLRNIPLGTRGINEMTRDARFTAIKHNKEAAAAAWDKISDVHGPDATTPPEPGTYLESVWKAARDEGLSYPALRSFAREALSEDAVRRAAMIAEKKRAHAIASGINPEWRKAVNAAMRANSDYTAVAGFDEIAQALGMESQEAWDVLSRWNQKIAKKSGDEIAAEALARMKASASSHDDADLDLDFFDVANDPTAYPDPAFSGAKLKPTADNRAFLLAKEYNLPAWWNYDKIMRSKLAEGGDEVLAALAKDETLSDHKFNEAWWKEMQAREAHLPAEQQWATSASDVDDFTINAKQMMPELTDIPIMYQSDLTDLANKLYHMPKQVLEDGLFNRGTATDAVDYMLHATRLKAGVSTMRSILKGKDVIDASGEAAGIKLADAWKEAGLTEDGLVNFAKEINGDMPPEALAQWLDKAVVDPDIASTMTRYVEGFKDPEKIQELMKWADSITGLFKGTLTIPYPAFHTRNRLSGIFANWAAGIYDSKAEESAQNLFFGKLDGAESEELLRELKTMNIVSVGKGGSSSAVFDKIDRLMGIGNNSMPVGVYDSNARNVASYITNPFGELVADTRQAYQQGGVRGAAKQLFMGGKRADGSTAVDLNPFGIKGGIDPLGRKGRMDQVDGFGKPVKGADRMTAPETTNAVYQAGSNANDYVEWMNRVGPYIALRRAGWSPALAARKVRQVQFDYRELAPIERKVFKRIIPFYSFMRKNLEQQTRLLMSNPGGRTAQAIRVENNAAREGKGKDGYVPKYLAESFAVRLPGGNDRDAKFFSQSGLLPFEEAFNRFSFDDGLNPLNVRRTGEKFLAQTHPVIQGPLEFVTGKQFWSGRKLDDLYQTPTSDQDVNLLMSKMPTSRLVNTIGGLLDSRKSLAEKAFNLAVGGAKVTDIDPVKQRALETRDILEMSLAADPDIAEYTGLYANDIASLVERYNNGDQEAARMLKLYQDIAKELRAIKKAEAAPPPQP